MHTRFVTRITLSALTIAAGLFAIGCTANTEKPQSLTGQVEKAPTPHYEAHGKGQQWGRIVYR